MVVPERLFTAPLPVVAAYLRSVFQAEGYVSCPCSARPWWPSTWCPKQQVRGFQSPAAPASASSRECRRKNDAAPGPTQGCGALAHPNCRATEPIFEAEIGFSMGPSRPRSFRSASKKPGRPALETKRLEIDRIESLGAMDVCNIQTESGEYLVGQPACTQLFHPRRRRQDGVDPRLVQGREGMIFKGGSGSGINLSRIRSSKELLSSGGTASGPLSFMRGADASAGTIKSGGATRRAAKMVILDVDHPDIEEFIETKAREEDKIRVLRDAGYDMDLGGRDMSSVQYQNANNSVRVNEEFMRALRAGQGIRAQGPHRWHCYRDRRCQEADAEHGAGSLGMRRPGHPVRRHHQRLAHDSGDGPHHRV